MKLFDEKFVHCVWDDELKGKEVFYADEIDDLIEEVNGEANDFGRRILYDKSCSHRHPFQIDKRNVEDCYRFVYYDPNYECKIAYNEGKQIQTKLNGFEDKDWIDVKNPTWESNFIFRIKPEENQKWWIMPNFDIFEQYNPSIGLNYFIEEQKDSYSRSRPPLKSDFNSKEEAEKWLKKYLKKEWEFKSAQDDINNLVCNLGHVIEKLQRQEMISEIDWKNCFELFNQSKEMGALKRVTE